MVWDLYKDRIGCSREEFDAYAGTAKEVAAITLANVTPYIDRMPVCQFEILLEEELYPPQSHCAIDLNHPWGKAISIAALLHGCQRSVQSQSMI